MRFNSASFCAAHECFWSRLGVNAALANDLLSMSAYVTFPGLKLVPAESVFEKSELSD